MQYNFYCNEKKINHNHSMAVAEFVKRLSPYCSVTINTVKALNLKSDFKKNGHYYFILTSGESTYSSVDFSKYIDNLQINGFSTVHIFIGYPEKAFDTLGLWETSNSFEKISLFSSSLSNETALILFLEQLYRSYTIIHGKTYHK